MSSSSSLLKAGAAAALIAAGIATWWVLDRQDEGAAPAAVIPRAERDAGERPGRSAAPAPFVPSGEDGRAAEAMRGGTDAELEDARHGLAVVEWWGVPLRAGAPRLDCDLVVVDGEDRPVSGATIEAWGRDAPRMTRLVTDERGRARLVPPPDVQSMFAFRDGLGCSGELDPWLVAPAAEREPGDFRASRPDRSGDQPRLVVVRLEPVAQLGIRVLKPDGQPAPEVNVLLEAGSKLQRTPMGKSHPGTSWHETDADGRTTLDVHLAHHETVQALRGRRSARSEVLSEALLAESELVLTLQAEPPKPEHASIIGVVVGADGAPREGVPVVLWPGDAPFRSDPRETWDLPKRRPDKGADGENATTSDQLGAFTMPGSTRGWLTFGPGALPIHRPELVNLSRPPVESVVLRACAEASICGQVQVPPGTSPLDVWVWALPRWPGEDASAQRRFMPAEAAWGWSMAPIDAGGAFELARLHPEGRYDVVARGRAGAEEWRAVLADVAAGSSGLRIDVGAEHWCTGSIRVTVRSARTGERVDEPSLLLLRLPVDRTIPERQPAPAKDVDGVQLIDGLRLGETCGLLVAAEGLGAVAVRDVVASEAGAAVEVVLPELGALECSVSAQGAPAPWAIVVASFLDQDLLIEPEPPHRTRADGAGVARLAGLKPGRWQLAVAHGDERAQLDVPVAPGAPTRAAVSCR
jgi:hypothetical protein